MKRGDAPLSLTSRIASSAVTNAFDEPEDPFGAQDGHAFDEQVKVDDKQAEPFSSAEVDTEVDLFGSEPGATRDELSPEQEMWTTLLGIYENLWQQHMQQRMAPEGGLALSPT